MAKRFLSIFLSSAFACILVSSSAQATPLFQAGEYPASLTGISAGNHVFRGNSGAIWKCAGVKSSMSGTITEGSSTITLTPSYAECTVLETPMTVNTNGCSYQLHLTEAIEGLPDTFQGKFDIVCPEGKSMEFSWGPCLWKFGAQQGVSGFKAEVKTAAEPKDVFLTIGATGITHSEQGGFWACPNKGVFATGALEAVVTLRADGPGKGLVPFWVE